MLERFGRSSIRKPEFVLLAARDQLRNAPRSIPYSRILRAMVLRPIPSSRAALATMPPLYCRALTI